ncbi:IPT/TIG domain-containing protein [Paractinoplanes hotanensis]|uniref:IPT/TIG domain-containing protein n=1 Tax=Paractinoplanes hotanensis TaxID=2906497 RepID=A0ABT0YCJ1_9ACTN|nr:IPT/TIG domain-containing protein [Actinoplanes hotanensis]MCM4083773.1 IPT/TIG domain-containing protein [Actinoplanes hotanensis]
MSKTHPSTGRRLLRAGIATGAVTAAVIAAGATPAFAAPVPMILSSTAGPSGGGNAVTGTVNVAANATGPFADGTTPVVQFQFSGSGTAASCRTLYQTPAVVAATAGVNNAGYVDAPAVQRISTAKIAFSVPTGLTLQAAQTSAKFNVCAYDSTSTTTSTLLATASYTIATRPTITGVTPASSPALGGQSITINGTGFATTATGNTVTVGGTALTGVKVNANGTSITGTTGARGAGTDLAVVVTTPGGSVSSLDPDNNGLVDDADPLTLPDNPIPFSYSNGATITPNTTPADTSVALSINGVGFRGLTFITTTGSTPSDANSHVLLTDGAYVPGANHGVEECLNVLVITDTELVCTLNLKDDIGVTAGTGAASAADAGEGTYTVSVVANGLPAATADEAKASIVNSGATFTVAPY